MEDDLLEIGKILKPHGVRGKVRLSYYGDNPEILLSTPTVCVTSKGLSRSLKVLSLAAQKKYYIIQFDTVCSYEAAEALAGAAVYIHKSALPPLEEDEYYWFDILGCRVLTEDGVYVGTVERIMSTGSNDVYVVTHEEHEVLIPATVDAIKNIDIAAKRMIVSPAEGQ